MDYFIHTETSNTQFLKLHKILKDMGIKNNRFFLALYDVNLRNVNPFDPNLDVFTRSRVIKEICINPWYYIREVCRIVAPGRPNGIQFELHRGNLASIWCALNDISQILLMPRQHGKSIGQVCLMSWIVYYGTSNTKIIFFNKKFDDSKLNMLRLKEIVDLWPKWLQESVSDSEDINNKERIKCHQRENFVDASPAPTSKDTADKLG